MKNRRHIVIAMLLIAVLGSLAWVFLHSPDPLFHGKPESAWITNIVYNGPNEQIKEWETFGADGIRVLLRGLDNANRPLERTYRKTYRQISSKLPGGLIRLLPAPRMDSTRATRMCVVHLLSNLSKDAIIALPAMIRELSDEDSSVRQLAITFFTQGEDQNAPLNRMKDETKRELLPEFVRLMHDGNEGVRNNAAVALRYYPEQPAIVVPVLVKALQDPTPRVRKLVAESLQQISPDEMAKARVVPIIIGVLKNPDDQIAYRAAELLGKMRKEPSLAVPALIESAQSTNTLVASTSVEALGNFPDQAETIVPVLIKAIDRPDGTIRWRAAAALKKIDPSAAAKAGVK